MQLTCFLGMQMHATFVLKCGKCTLYATIQCNGKLYNVHDILSLFCDFDFDLIFFLKTKINCSFERGDNSCNLILSLQISLGTPLECMLCLI